MVTNRRLVPNDGPDFYKTPAWGTQALLDQPLAWLEPVECLIAVKMESLRKKLEAGDFKQDPVIGYTHARISFAVGSIQKRHGPVIELSMNEILKTKPHLIVWNEKKFEISEQALTLCRMNGEYKMGAQLEYGEMAEKRQVDLLCYFKDTQTLFAYEIKRANSKNDSGKESKMLQNMHLFHALLKSYGESRGLEIQEVGAKTIAYYGTLTLPPQYHLVPDQFNEHFRCDVTSELDQVDGLYAKAAQLLLGAF